MDVAIDDWIRGEGISFSLNSPEGFNSAIDAVVRSLGKSVELLGFGEGLHGGEEILLLRNRLFQRLVEAHGYRAIAIESGFESGRLVNEYVLGCAAPGPTSYEEVKERGFGHWFGQVEANRELVEWMRGYNADRAHGAKVRFYGFDIPSSPNGYASPRRVLMFAVD